jgi:hypothetical protein
MAHLKRRIIEVKAETNCLALALIIAIAKITKDPNYKASRQGYKIYQVIHNLLATTGIDLRNGGVFPNSISSKIISDNMFCSYRLICDSIMFEGQVETSDCINLLYDDTVRQYHVI